MEEVTSQLDMSDIREVVTGADVVVLQDAIGVEVVYKTFVLEMIMDFPGFGLVKCGGMVLCSFPSELAPLRLVGQYVTSYTGSMVSYH